MSRINECVRHDDQLETRVTLPPTLGLVLAGGLARRIGGGDKALIRIGGTSILQRVVACLVPQCRPLILNANGDPSRFADTGLQIVADSVPASEHEEVLAKSHALVRALELAQGGL